MSRNRKQSGGRRLLASMIRILWRAFAVGIILSAVLVLSLRWFNPPTTAFMIRAQLHGDVSPPRWVDWREISPNLAIAVIAAEDQKFPHHFGLDLEQIEKAVSQGARGGRLRGASTITQQLAKNLFLWPGRSLWRKAIEAYFALLMETLLSKQRILELYLNVVEFGDGRFGVGVAAPAYYATAPAKLSAYQASMMAAVLPNPKKLRLDAPSDYVKRRARDIRRQIRALGGVGYLHTLN